MSYNFQWVIRASTIIKENVQFNTRLLFRLIIPLSGEMPCHKQNTQNNYYNNDYFIGSDFASLKHLKMSSKCNDTKHKLDFYINTRLQYRQNDINYFNRSLAINLNYQPMALLYSYNFDPGSWFDPGYSHTTP